MEQNSTGKLKHKRLQKMYNAWSTCGTKKNVFFKNILRLQILRKIEREKTGDNITKVTFCILVTYMEEGYKSRRGENVYLISWKLQGNFIVLFIEAPCCQYWLHHWFQTTILKDMLLVIQKWFWLTLAYVLHLLNRPPSSSLCFMWKWVLPT